MNVDLANTPGRTCMVDGKEFLFFSGYSYLGMNYVKEFIDIVKQGIDKYGVLFPSSRISNTQLNLYQEFENELSLITGMKETVSFSSGYLAGKAISEILSSYKNIFVAPHTHPAILLKNITEQTFKNFLGWSGFVIKEINNSKESEFFLIADSVNILESTINDFSFLDKINDNKKIIFLIDDSHGIGILDNGKGIISSLPKKESIEYILTFSLSKAFNIEGGAVTCSTTFSEKLRNHPNYTGSTAINPSLAYAFLKSKSLYQSQREKLYFNIKYLKNNLPSTSTFINEYNLPVFIVTIEDADSLFYEKKIIISSFSYPYKQSKKINRAVVNALHTKPDLDKIISALFSLNV